VRERGEEFVLDAAGFFGLAPRPSSASRCAVSKSRALSSASAAREAMASTSRTSASTYTGPPARPSSSVPSSRP
jgi:hypothetical protein